MSSPRILSFIPFSSYFPRNIIVNWKTLDVLLTTSMVTERLDCTRLNRYVWTDKYGTSDNNFVAENGNNKGQVSDSEWKKTISNQEGTQFNEKSLFNFIWISCLRCRLTNECVIKKPLLKFHMNEGQKLNTIYSKIGKLKRCLTNLINKPLKMYYSLTFYERLFLITIILINIKENVLVTYYFSWLKYVYIPTWANYLCLLL